MTKWLNQFLAQESSFQQSPEHLSALSVMSVPIFRHPDQKTENESKNRTDKTDNTDKLVSISLIADYEERLAIAEYDGQQSVHQSHRIAYVDAFSTVFATLPYEDESTDTKSDWLEKRLQMTQDWLRKQGVERVG